MWSQNTYTTLEAAKATSKKLDMQADMQADRLEEQHADAPTIMPLEPADHKPTFNNEFNSCKK